MCAALLHDVGHGPFSHVFEEVSRELGVAIAHEDYTKQIIEQSEVSTILKEAGILPETLSFFSKEAGEVAYSSIISSQLDADRLDFLVRDRHFTGIRSSIIDLEWLLDSLRIEKIPAEVGSQIKQFSFVLDIKGLSVVEEYLSSYSKMYSNIYFHKTTRAVQFMVGDILKDVFKDPESLAKIPDEGSLKRYFSEAPRPSLDAYLDLDDISIIGLLGRVARGSFGEPTELAIRFFKRDLYKCFAPPKRPKEAPPRERISRFIERLKDAGIFHHRDLIPAKGYKQYEIMGDGFLKNILVYSPYDKDHKPVADLIPGIAELADKSPLRFYFKNDIDRESAEKIWEKLA